MIFIKSITITVDDNIFDNINRIAETCFNNNRNNAVTTILEKALNSGIQLEIGNHSIPIKKIIERQNTTIINFDNLRGIFKAEFKKNFFLLNVKLQNSLFSLLKDLQDRHSCNFGTASNISIYTPDKNLCFYINISGSRGDIPIDRFLQSLSNKNFTFKQYHGIRENYPRNTIWISKRDQFVRGKFYNEDISIQYFNKILNLLSIDTHFDAVELSSYELNLLIGKI